MIGMLATGLLLRTSGFVHGVPHGWTTILFSLALSAVVARAGIRVPLRRNTSKVGVWSTVLIGGAPVLIETVWLAGILHGALRVPLDWATVAAAAVACVSPGVVVPILVGLADTSREWAEARIVRTLLAAVGVDVLVATTLFGVASAVLERRLCGNHSPVTLWWILFRAARELALGGMAGAGIAAAAVVLAPRVRHETVVKVWKWGGDKHVALFAATSTWMALAKTMGCPGAATSGVLVAWAAVGNMWDSTDVDIADKRLKHIWTLTEPFLFPLIGSSIHLAAFQPRILAAAGACVAASVAIKLCTTYAATTITRFERWERGFAAGVWTGKASVQAALSSVPLSLLSKHALTIPDLAQESIHGQTAFAAIVAAILIGAPLAASWVAFYKGSPTANTTTMQFAARSADATNEGDADAIGEKAAGMKSLEKTASKETLSLGKKPRILRSAVEGVMVV
ncbi:hypothetical protein DFJ77DRAFT_435813 [Powellomyces hirtus]|nr:hypothetical protein DFJ77DRAFT_435813 [Powellomyces hirtus]